MNKKPVKLPLSTKDEFIKDKRINYTNYGILIYFSNYQSDNDDKDKDFEGCYDIDRYIYHNKVLINQNEIEKISKTKLNTFINNVKKIAKITEGEMVGVRKLDNGRIVYDLKKGEQYILIDSEMLKILCQVLNSNAIKAYCFLKWRCRKKSIVSRKEIAINIGLSQDSCKQLNQISEITTALDKLGLIKKYNSTMKKDEGIFSSECYYEIVSDEEWRKEWRKKRTKEKKEKEE